MTDFREIAAKKMEDYAANNDHGYDQAQRWGPDFDCSSLVIEVWEAAGVPVKSRGATYTGNMYKVFLECGFEDVTSEVDLNTGSGLVRGDVLLNHVHHVSMYTGGGVLAEAAINEHGTVSGGESGDQTGREIRTRTYYNYPWNSVLRYAGKSSESAASGIVGAGKTSPTYFYTLKIPLLKKGLTGPYVHTLQYILAALNYYHGEIDGIFGPQLESAVKEFQRDNGLEADGEVGAMTWPVVLGGG